MSACDQVTIGIGSTSDWLKNGARFFTQLQSVAVQNQSNREITFDTQLNTRSVTHFESIASVMSFITFNKAVSVLWPARYDDCKTG